jgi:hypothetical protein
MNQPNTPPKQSVQDIKTEIDQLIEELRRIANAYNPLELLAHLAISSLFVPDNSNESPQIEEHLLEYAMSLFLADPFPKIPKTPTPDIVNHIMERLKNLYQYSAIYYGLTSESKTGDPTETEIVLDQRLQTLFVRGDAYKYHAKQQFNDITDPHKEFLLSGFSFTPLDLSDFWAYTEQVIQDQFNAQIQVMRELCKQAKVGDQNAKKRFQEAMNTMDPTKIFRITPRSDQDRAILAVISAKFGDNQEFLAGIPKWAGWPLNPTIIAQKPIIEQSGNFYVFHPPFLGRSTLSIVEGLIAQVDGGYWQNTYLRKRDDYVERTAVRLISNMLKGSQEYANLYYDYQTDGEDRRGEVDGIILYDDCLLIVEVKASGLNPATRRGAPASIASDLKDSLDKAYQQAKRVLDLIHSTCEGVFFDEKGAEALRLRFSDYKHIFLVSVTRELFASLATNLHLIRKLGFIQGKEWPWAVCLNDLRIITEILDHPTLFLHYLIRRLAANDCDKLHVTDEIDYFGHFLHNGLYLEEEQNFGDATQVVFLGFSESIDHYYRDIEIGKAPSKPVYPIPSRVGELLSVMEDIRPKHFTTAAIRILSFSGESHKEIDKGIAICEEAFNRRKGTLCLISTHDGGGYAIILGCTYVGTPWEQQMIERAMKNKNERGVAMAILILWHPPLPGGRIVVHIL